MDKLVSLATAGAALAIGFGAATANAVVIVNRTETTANLAMLKADLGAVANVTFTSDLPGAAEMNDSMTAFNITRTGELRAIPQPGFDTKSEVLANQVNYYDDAAMTILSDTVSRYVDKNGKELFTFSSPREAIPEPATWAMMLTGLGLAGVALRRRRTTAPAHA